LALSADLDRFTKQDFCESEKNQLSFIFHAQMDDDDDLVANDKQTQHKAYIA
jgi:hypothetical protein